VVPGLDLLDGAALGVRNGVVAQDRQLVLDRRAPAHNRELVVEIGREVTRDRRLVARQEVDDEALATLERGQRRRVVADADEQERRIERERADRGRREPVERAVEVARGDDAHPVGKAPEDGAVARGGQSETL
jgi:hypothetical protein